MTTRYSTIAASLLLALAACGGPTSGAGPATPEPASSTEPADKPDPAPVNEDGPTAWSDDLSKEDKGAFMKTHVMPKMKEVFQSASPDKYASFKCQTCHGKEWKDHPKDALPKLTMKDGKFDVPEDQAMVVDFMMKKVVPEMATLFGQEPYNPETNTGFGCAGCHVVEM